MKVDGAVLGLTSLIVLMVSVDVKQHRMNEQVFYLFGVGKAHLKNMSNATQNIHRLMMEGPRQKCR